jgi:hypothetical protein
LFASLTPTARWLRGRLLVRAAGPATDIHGAAPHPPTTTRFRELVMLFCNICNYRSIGKVREAVMFCMLLSLKINKSPCPIFLKRRHPAPVAAATGREEEGAHVGIPMHRGNAGFATAEPDARVAGAEEHAQLPRARIRPLVHHAASARAVARVLSLGQSQHTYVTLLDCPGPAPVRSTSVRSAFEWAGPCARASGGAGRGRRAAAWEARRRRGSAHLGKSSHCEFATATPSSLR